MKNINDRINQLISLADKTLDSAGSDTAAYVTYELFNEFKTSSLSTIRNIYGVDHSYYTNFNEAVYKNYTSHVLCGKGILKAIKSEIDGGWIFTMKGIVSAEIFSDFLDMSDYLLKESYKDPAAVMIGSVLEEHLRQLCIKNSIPTEYSKSGKMVHKKADSLNSELSSTMIYNKLDHKNVTAWLDLRNKAAHGKYLEYNQEQVENMLQGVLEFISRNNV